MYSKREFLPEELKIVRTFRFAGITNTEDETELFALAANDGTKGALVTLFSCSELECKLDSGNKAYSSIAFLRLKALKQVFLFFVAVFYS